MNQELIGSFIQERRKGKSLTQVDLSEKLGVSDRTVSKWERGVCLPDISLFKPLCNELDISLNELFNGKKDTKDPNEDGIVNYIKYQHKKNRFHILLSVLVSLVVIIFSILLIYFINNYNKIKIYRVFGESENFSYTNAMLITSNMKNIYYDGIIESSSDNINVNDITYMTLKCDDKIIEGGNYILNGIISEEYGYNEYFSEEILEKMDKWYIEITYKLNDKETTERINLTFENEMNNNNFINNKKQSISDNNNSKINYDEFVKIRENETENLIDYLKDNGFKEDKDYYTKVISKDSKFSVIIREWKSDSSIYYYKNDYKVTSDFTGLTHKFTSNDFKYSYYYEQDTDKIKCESGKCPDNMYEIAKEYVKIFNKEFDQVLTKSAKRSIEE